MDSAEAPPQIGIFWVVRDRLVAAGCGLEEGEEADHWIDYLGGHADYWERWQEAGARWLSQHDLPLAILTSEYDEHPRGRIVFDRKANHFLLYADRRLQTARWIRAIKDAFSLDAQSIRVLSDPHYR